MAPSLVISKNFWNSKKSENLLNPRFKEEEREQIKHAVSQWDKKGLVWLRSSGTESSQKGIKLVGLKRESILNAAQSVNAHYGITGKDIWLNCLPTFHIGGLSIFARAFVANNKVMTIDKWDCEFFYQQLELGLVSLTSLVPTQIYDLVKAGHQAPSSLRVVFVGGGAMSPLLFQQAVRLGWPLVLCYGMTETSAMIAGTELSELGKKEMPTMCLLPHVELLSHDNKWICRANSLFEGYLWVKGKQWEYQSRPEPFVLDDRLIVDDRKIRVLGRESELIKVLGETVNLNELKEKLSPFIRKDFFIHPQKEERKGYQLYLIVEGRAEVINLNLLNEALMPYERIEGIHFVDKFDKTDLGKLRRSEIIKSINFN